MQTDELAIRTLISDWLAASRAGQTDRLLNMLADDVVFVSVGNPPMTKADFERASRAQVSSGMVIDANSDLQEVRVVGDWAYARSHLNVSITKPGGTPIRRSGDVLTIFSRVNGAWLFARDANLLVLDLSTAPQLEPSAARTRSRASTAHTSDST
jgi:uncharacterized protein (TIGR02246 family)